MAFSLNKISLIGSLGKDAETKEFESGSKKTSFTLATSHSYKDKNGKWKEQITWHNIASWNLTEFYLRRLCKGAKFFISGRLEHRKYEAADGTTKYFTEVISSEIIPLGKEEVNEKSSGFEKSTDKNNENLPKWVTDDEYPF